MGVTFHEEAVFERAGLHLVGVGDEVAGAGVLLFGGNGAPLETGGKAGASAAPERRLFHEGRDLGGTHLKGLLERLVASRADDLRERERLLSRADIPGQWLLHLPAPAFLPERLENRIQSVGSEVSVKLASDHHGGRAVAGAEARNREEREEAVRGGLAGLDAEAAGESGADVVVTHEPAADAVAEEDQAT